MKEGRNGASWEQNKGVFVFWQQAVSLKMRAKRCWHREHRITWSVQAKN